MPSPTTRIRELLAAGSTPSKGGRDSFDWMKRVTESFCLFAPAMCDVIDAAQEVLPFFASVIKSGEPWTGQCQDAINKWHQARSALDRAAEEASGE